MKRLVIIVFLFVSTLSFSQGFKQKIRSMLFTHDLAPIASYTNRLNVTKGIDTLTIHSIGIGIGFTNGSVDKDGFPVAIAWQYLALPYLKLDFNFANQKGRGQLFNPKDGSSPLLLSAGVTGGKGIAILLIPFGINATAGLATDFKDGYFQYGLAYDAGGISVGITGLLNFTNSNNSFYKKELGLEFRYIWGWD